MKATLAERTAPDLGEEVKGAVCDPSQLALHASQAFSGAGCIEGEEEVATERRRSEASRGEEARKEGEKDKKRGN